MELSIYFLKLCNSKHSFVATDIAQFRCTSRKSEMDGTVDTPQFYHNAQDAGNCTLCSRLQVALE